MTLPAFIRRICQQVVRTIFAVEVINAPAMKNAKKCIIASNHLANIDPLIIGFFFPDDLAFLAKKELFDNKILGAVIGYFGAIPINRHGVDRAALKNSRNILKSGKSIVIFPEGTRKRYVALPGVGMIALGSQVNILPVKLENTDCLWECFLRKKKIRMIVSQKLLIEPYLAAGLVKDNYLKLSIDIWQSIEDTNAN